MRRAEKMVAGVVYWSQKKRLRLWKQKRKQLVSTLYADGYRDVVVGVAAGGYGYGCDRGIGRNGDGDRDGELRR